MSNNDLDYDCSINELADLCLTSRTSVLRFAKKLGFKGYSELKYFLTSEKFKNTKTDTKEDMKKDEEISEVLCQVFSRIKKSEKIYIYGNGAYEEIIGLEIKRLLLNLKILSETYMGGDEIENFNKNTLKNSTIFIIDFSNNELSQNILVNIANLPCFKIFVGKENRKIKMSDYNLLTDVEKEEDIYLMSPVIKDLEEFFIKFNRYRGCNENI